LETIFSPLSTEEPELSELEAKELALVENLQRQDLNPVDETEGILSLLSLQENLAVDEVISRPYRLYNEQKGNVDNSNPNVWVRNFEASVTNLFNSLGRLNWESFVKTRLPLLKLPEDILKALRSGQIEYTKAKAIATLKDEAARTEILALAIANSLSLSQIKERVNAAKPTKEKEELKSRFDVTYKQAKKSKQLWQDPKKRKKLESLLSQLEKLIESESSSMAKPNEQPVLSESFSEKESNTEAEEKGLSDRELGEVLGVSNLLIRDYRVKGKKPPAGWSLD
jgi:ParB family chromosome partitioning protein